MLKRSVFLKNESHEDYLQAFVNSGLEKPDFVKERLKANGWTEDQETRFKRHCEVIGYRLPS